MSSAGRYSLKRIQKAPEICLPGCRWEKKLHRWHVFPPRASEAPFFLPKGEHGKKAGQAEIERGHVRSMARQFTVLDCMQKELPGL